MARPLALQACHMFEHEVGRVVSHNLPETKSNKTKVSFDSRAIIRDLICAPLEKALAKVSVPKKHVSRRLEMINFLHPIEASVEEKRGLSDWPPALAPIVERWWDTTPGEASTKFTVVQLELDEM